MTACIRHLVLPRFQYASNTSRKHQEDYFTFAGCDCAVKLGGNYAFHPRKELRAIADKWEQEQLRAFEERTAHWTLGERERYRNQVFPPKKEAA